MKDYIGNTSTVFRIIGATSHSESERQPNDYYATEPYAVELLLEKEKFNNNIWECACGEGHISDVLSEHGYKLFNTDLVNRGYEYHDETLDFLKLDVDIYQFDGDIITNPPYKYAKEFVEKALDVIPIGNKVAMFLKLTFLESQSRRKLFEQYPPKVIYVSSKRLNCAKNGRFDLYPSSAIAYAWFVWEKGFVGDPIIKWIN